MFIKQKPSCSLVGGGGGGGVDLRSIRSMIIPLDYTLHDNFFEAVKSLVTKTPPNKNPRPKQKNWNAKPDSEITLFGKTFLSVKISFEITFYTQKYCYFEKFLSVKIPFEITFYTGDNQSYKFAKC